MTRYEKQQLHIKDGGIEVDGRIIHVISVWSNTIMALVELPEEDEDLPATFTDDPEGVTYLCNARKADDTPCEREVSGPGETCWQHPVETGD
jgi:hypothetical protein